MEFALSNEHMAQFALEVMYEPAHESELEVHLLNEEVLTEEELQEKKKGVEKLLSNLSGPASAMDFGLMEVLEGVAAS